MQTANIDSGTVGELAKANEITFATADVVQLARDFLGTVEALRPIRNIDLIEYLERYPSIPRRTR
jgi:hypothetical protein